MLLNWSKILACKVDFEAAIYVCLLICFWFWNYWDIDGYLIVDRYHFQRWRHLVWFDVDSCIWKCLFFFFFFWCGSAACQRHWPVVNYMGQRVEGSNLSMSSKPSSAISGKKTYKKPLVASRLKGFAHRNYEHLVSLTHDGLGSSAVGRLTFFLLKVAALEAVRRLSKSRCPCVWRGLQGLQILVYPPFKWIQRWAPFKGLVKSMQVSILKVSWKLYLDDILKWQNI